MPRSGPVRYGVRTGLLSRLYRRSAGVDSGGTTGR
ncbi:hypothetical protein H4W79_001252 [Nocardiopsis terrae]|uniref:Uncharacterized protein n=1 Tax=Nocardiopsis terrae TaxID=372655 RepID=A0ABR9HDC3_9ACTN|nr:hypothetical protein [Nocardiopsis terrae]